MFCIITQAILIFIFLSPTYGLEIIPNPNEGLIFYNVSDKNSSLQYRKELETFYLSYQASSNTKNSVNCTYGVPPSEGSNQFCNVDLEALEQCSPSSGFEYYSNYGHPCVFIKFRKIFNWEPEYYNSSTVPNDMPMHLKQHISYIEREDGPDDAALKMVWVTCSGEYPADIEHLEGMHFLRLGFPGHFFPVRNEAEYLIPFIAVQFRVPESGILVNVLCQAWAKNLPNEVVRFAILVDQ